jgi:dihydrolipoamide dehydrogenase
MEFASIFHNLGTQVTVLGRSTFLKSVDPQLSRRYRALCARRGLKVEVGLTFKGITPTDDGRLCVRYLAGGEERHAHGEVVLLASGCLPLADNLGLEEAGVRRDSSGFVQVDAGMRTAVADVYAAGDVTGGLLLAHVASHEGIVAAENALGRERVMDYRAVPNCVYTDPELASVGMTESDAREAGVDAAVARFPLSANSRAMTMCADEGMVRLVHERGSGRLLGAHIMAPHASELIAEAALAIKAGLKAEDLADTMHQHPTLSEAVMEAGMAAARGEAIHFRHV